MSTVNATTFRNWVSTFLVAGTMAIGAAFAAASHRRRGRMRILARELADRDQVLRTRSAFLAHMRHDLRTPLNGIIGFTDLVRSGDAGELTEVQRDFLSESLQLSNDLLRMIDDMLDLAALDGRELRPRTERVDVQAAFTDAFGEARALVAESGHQLVLDRELAYGVYVSADPTLLHRALVRVLKAARRIAPRGSEIRFGVEADAGAVRFLVRDRGEPLSESEVRDALAPWLTEKRLLARRHEGMGLALPLARAIAEAHGGTLRLGYQSGWNVAALILPRLEAKAPAE